MGTDDVIFEHAHETPAPGEYRLRTETPESIVETVTAIAADGSVRLTTTERFREPRDVSPALGTIGRGFVIEPDGSLRYPNGEVVPVDANGMVTIDLPRGLLG